jgi:hypothetical protein
VFAKVAMDEGDIALKDTPLAFVLTGDRKCGPAVCEVITVIYFESRFNVHGV